MHTLVEMLRLRMFAIAAGYEDANDCDTLRHDPVFKMAVGRAPESGEPLCSQPTMSRLENAPSTDRDRADDGGDGGSVLCQLDRAPASIMLDIDDTFDAVHGQQQLSLFNAHYDERCFLPIHIYEGDERQAGGGDPARRARRRAGSEVRTILKHVIAPHPPALAQGRHPGARRQPLRPARSDGLVRSQRRRLHLRLRRQRRCCDAMVRPVADALCVRARRAGARRSGAPGRCCATAPRAGRQQRRVVARIEATTLGLDIRYVVTSLEGQRPSISTRPSTAAAARPRTSSSCTRPSSPPIAPRAATHGPISSG